MMETPSAASDQSRGRVLCPSVPHLQIQELMESDLKVSSKENELICGKILAIAIVFLPALRLRALIVNSRLSINIYSITKATCPQSHNKTSKTSTGRVWI